MSERRLNLFSVMAQAVQAARDFEASWDRFVATVDGWELHPDDDTDDAEIVTIPDDMYMETPETVADRIIPKPVEGTP